MLTSPTGKIYIGQTIRPIEKRFKQHLKKGSGCAAIYNAIQYHGWDNFEKDWYECPDEDLNFDEELLVREMGTLAPDGYNLREGGGNTGKMSEDSKKKISEANKGKTHTEETKKKWSELRKGENNSMYGKNHTEETRKKIGEINLGKTHTEETKKKMSDAHRGEKSYLFGKTGEKHHMSKRVYQYALNGTLIQSFGSGMEAARHLNRTNSSAISLCASGKQEKAYGFKWSLVLH